MCNIDLIQLYLNLENKRYRNNKGTSQDQENITKIHK